MKRSAAILLFVLSAASIFLWHARDTRPSSMDETKHMQLALDYRSWLTAGQPLTNPWAHVYPPVYHLVLIPFLSAGVPSETKAAAAHLLFLAVFVAACHLLVRAQNRPSWEATLAALLAAGYPYVLWCGRRALIDLPLMAAVAFSMALLARTNGFRDRKASLLWGLSVGFGLLVKAPCLFFVVGPALWVLAAGREPARGKNFLLGAGLGLACCAPWYWWNGAMFLDKAAGLVREPTVPGSDPRSLSGWFTYLLWWPRQLGWPSLLVTLAGIGLAWRRRRSMEGLGLLAAWAVAGYLGLSLLVNKDPRHSLPLLPALALLAAAGWSAWAAGSSRRQTGLLIAALGLFLFNGLVYDPPQREDWKHGPIVDLMARHRDPSLPFLSAAFLGQHERFFARGFRWSALQRGVDLRPVSVGDSDTSFAEFIVRRWGGSQGDDAERIDREWNNLRPAEPAFHDLYETLGAFPLPDGSVAVLYHRRSHPEFKLPALSADALAFRIRRALQHWVRGELRVQVEASPKELKQGRAALVRVIGNSCAIRDVPVRRVELTLIQPRFNLYRLWNEGRLGLLAAREARPKLEVAEEDLKVLLARAKGIDRAEVRFADSHVLADAAWKGLSLSADAEVLLRKAPAALEIVLDRLHIARLPIPGWILGKVYRQTLPLDPVADFPVRLAIERILVDHQKVSVE